MAQLNDDCFADEGRLMTIGAALELLDQRMVAVTEAETVGLRAAANRILAEEVTAEQAVPAHDNSAVDGYAVRFADLDDAAETTLEIVGRAAAGHPFQGKVKPGEAVRIFTGAPMPGGLDTVLMQEDCVERAGQVRFPAGIAKGANRRLAGEDVKAGTMILKRGQRLRPQEIGLAASIGRASLSVFAPLKVAIFSTGDEIRDPGQDMEMGCVYDANRYTLAALLEGMGCAVTDLGILKDDLNTIRDALAGAAETHGLIVTSGGMSVGEEDHVKEAVEALGRMDFWRLAIKPGRPIAMGQIGRVPFIGLPGNPVAAMVTFLRVARPMILRLAGCADLTPTLYRVRAAFDHKKKKDRREWIRARLALDADGTLVANKFPRDGAGILSSMVEADGLVELPEDLTRLSAGTMVDFLPFSEVR